MIIGSYTADHPDAVLYQPPSSAESASPGTLARATEGTFTRFADLSNVDAVFAT